jgi:hypothetical protein
MLKIFRTDIFMQAIIILIVSAVMWMGVFIDPQPMPMVGGGQLYYWLTGLLSPLWGTIIAYLLVLVEGFLLNGILYRHKMISQSTLMPMLFYVIAMSLGTPTLTPIVLGSLMLLLAIDQLMLTTTLLSLPLDKVFGAASCIALGTLFCPAMAVFFIPLVTSMFNYSLYGWRDWTMLLLGIMAPYLIMETIFFVGNQMFYRNYLILYSFTDTHWVAKGNWLEWVGSSLFILTLLMGIGAAFVNSQSHNINFKKNITTLLLFLLGSLAYMLYTSIIPVPTQAFALPFACCCTSLFIESRRKEFGANLLFVTLILLFVIWRILS